MASLNRAANLIVIYLKAGIPVFVWGKPGEGKSDMIRMIARLLKYDLLIDKRASQMDSLDIIGIPSTCNGRTRYNPPEWLPSRETDSGKRILMFWDELNTAVQTVQTSLYQWILDGETGGVIAPEGLNNIAAGNYQSDKAAANRLSSALANRFAHVDAVNTVEAWTLWAEGRAESVLREDCISFAPNVGIPPELIAFHQWCEQRGVAMLHNMATAQGEELRAFPSSRTWAYVARILNAPRDLLPELIAGLVGKAASAELIAFLEIWRAMPSIPAILAAPDSIDVPADVSLKYAVASALGRAINHANIGAAIRYLGRVSPSFQVMALNAAIERDSSLQNTAPYVQWGIANQTVAI
jgi:hypothetical protein